MPASMPPVLARIDAGRPAAASCPIGATITETTEWENQSEPWLDERLTEMGRLPPLQGSVQEWGYQGMKGFRLAGAATAFGIAVGAVVSAGAPGGGGGGPGGRFVPAPHTVA